MKLLNENKKPYHQVFQLFTEESWVLNNKKFNKNITLLFSGKKYEVFIEANDQTIIYYIGLGKEHLQNFEFQQIANTFSQTQKKNIQPTSTLLIADFINEKQFEEFTKGLLLGTYTYPFDKAHPFWNENFTLHFENLTQKKLDQISFTT